MIRELLTHLAGMYIPTFITKKNKPSKYKHAMQCAKLGNTLDTLKYLYDVRFSLLIQSQLSRSDSISKEGLAEVSMFMSGLIKEIERGHKFYHENSSDIAKWCTENNVKMDK